LKIALVVTGGVDRSGQEAVIPALLNLIGRLQRRHQVHVFALAQYADPCTYPLLGAAVHNLAALPVRSASDSNGVARQANLGILRAVPGLLRAMRSVGPFDVLHAYQGVPAAAVATVAARRLKLPFVVSFDGDELVTLPDIRYGLGLTLRGRLLRRLIVRTADKITVSTLYMSLLAREHGLRAEVIPLGVDLTKIPAQGRAVEGPPWRLLHVASLNPLKDQPTLLRALTLVRAQEPAVHLTIVGGDSLGGAIHAQCELLGLSAHVTFTGALPANEVWPFYARSHLMVLPSRHEAAGVAVLEAAACSLATVGTDVGYVSEWALRGAARAVRVGDAADLARAILDLLRDREARRRMAEEARVLSCAHNADWTAGRFEELYQQLVENAGSPKR
jgi:glycosyltransferase involved in cell wall biosynthesis